MMAEDAERVAKLVAKETFDLTATVTDTGWKQPIRESVQVQVQ